MDLGFELVKTKDRDYWHRPDDAFGPSLGYGDDDDDEDDKEKPEAKKTAYPVLSVDDCPKDLYDYPEEDECVIQIKIKRRSMTEDEDGKAHYSVEMAVMSIDSTSKKKSNRVTPLDRTKSAMKDYEKSRR